MPQAIRLWGEWRRFAFGPWVQSQHLTSTYPCTLPVTRRGEAKTWEKHDVKPGLQSLPHKIWSGHGSSSVGGNQRQIKYSLTVISTKLWKMWRLQASLALLSSSNNSGFKEKFQMFWKTLNISDQVFRSICGWIRLPYLEFLCTGQIAVVPCSNNALTPVAAFVSEMSRS